LMRIPLRLGLAIALVAVVGFVVGIATRSLPRAERMDAVAPPTLVSVSRSTDALVIASDATLIRVTHSKSGATYQVADLTVTAILTETSSSSQSQLDADYPSPPTILVGTLRVYEPLGVAPDSARITDSSLATLSRTPTPTAVLLGYWDPGWYPDWPAAWSVVTSATVKDGGLTFDAVSRYWGDDVGKGIAADLDAANPAGLAPVDALSEWLREGFVVRGGGGPGVMQLALDASRPTPDAQADWWATTPESRPLDVEATPPEVVASLVESQVMVLIDPELVRDDLYMAILTPHGVAHIAHLSGGSHPADVLSDPADDWTIVLTSDLENLSGGRRVGLLTAANRASSPFALIELHSSPSGGAAEVTAVSRDAFGEALDAVFGSSTQSPVTP
jgi:hypothetical protein